MSRATIATQQPTAVKNSITVSGQVPGTRVTPVSTTPTIAARPTHLRTLVPSDVSMETP